MRWVEAHWGTRITLEVPDDTAPGMFDELRTWFVWVDEMFSTWRDDSEVMRLADGRLSVDQASPDVRAVLERCEELKQATGGAFDIAVGAHPDAAPAPGRAAIDPSGFVKGWAMDRVADRLAAVGAREFWAGAGGDVAVRTATPSGGRWRVGIQHPWESGSLAAVIELDNGAVATSGRCERGDHVLDPRTGRPATGLMSVTVVGSDLGSADAFATAALALGDDGMEWLATVPGIEGMGITDDRQVITTLGFRSLLLGV